MNLSDITLHPRTRLAAEIILGGIDAHAFWGFGVDDFGARLDQGLREHIADPARINLGLRDDPTAMPSGASAQHRILARRPGALDAVVDPADLFSRAEVDALANEVRLVGLNGGIGSGKDTLGDHLVQNFGFVKMSFADPLREAASVLYGIPMGHFIDRDLKEQPLSGLKGPDGKPMSPRKVLQLMGTEVCRSIYQDLWADRLRLRIAALACNRGANQATDVVIADVRFENEAQFIRSLRGGQIARIHRQAAQAATAAHGAWHASEAGISKDAGDILLANDSTVAEYLDVAVKALRVSAPVPPTQRPRPR